jgi:hypothetical protein
MKLALYRAVSYWRMPLGIASHHRTRTSQPQPLTFRRVIAMGKRKAESASEDEVLEEVPSEDEEVEKKKKPRAKAKPKRTEPFVSEQGWNVVPPSLIWRWVQQLLLYTPWEHPSDHWISSQPFVAAWSSHAQGLIV